jgi:hypothetical protein
MGKRWKKVALSLHVDAAIFASGRSWPFMQDFAPPASHMRRDCGR